MADTLQYTNKLIHEKSPYLLQHAHNPVEWYAWGEEAFKLALDSDKPIFLSIGYATCHWCHVMEKESFKNAAIAKLLNENFINIKVDREELPHIDSLYMEFAQSLMSGVAGWPLNILLTPAKQPFFAATYLPPYANQRMLGLADLIQRIKEIWTGEERTPLLLQAVKIVELFTESMHVKGEELPQKAQIEETAGLLFKMADPVYGGIKGAPKFPIGYQNNFLLHYFISSKDKRALFIVERTLEMMHKGGIYDHLGGGFSRYSVDEKWLIPHFEKMLYDNAILVASYFEAWQITKKPLYKQICEEIITYVARDMTHPAGGFYSAEDADSEGEEGLFYTWTLAEINQALGEQKARLFCDFYQITAEGNFKGRTVLNTPYPLGDFAANHHLPKQTVLEEFAKQRDLLWNIREQRIHPFKDDKILTSWNGLMIDALVKAGEGFNNSAYSHLALKAAHFIQQNLWKEGKLLRRWREQEAVFKAGLDDYAFMIKAVLSLFEAGYGTKWLAWAIEMTAILTKEFKAEQGAFYQTTIFEENLILRKMEFSDGAEPSGNAIHCENLLRLFAMTADPLYLREAEDILRAANKLIINYPTGYCYHILNLNAYYHLAAPKLVIVLNQAKESFLKIKQALFTQFILHPTIIWKEQEDAELVRLIPSLKDLVSIEEQTTLYVCTKQACSAPIIGIEAILSAIKKL